MDGSLCSRPTKSRRVTLVTAVLEIEEEGLEGRRFAEGVTTCVGVCVCMCVCVCVCVCVHVCVKGQTLKKEIVN